MLQHFTKSLAIRRTLPTLLVRRTLADDRKPTDDPTTAVDAPAGTNKASDEKPQPASKAEGTQRRLNDLLASMSTDSNLGIVKTVVASKPKAKVTQASKENQPKPKGGRKTDATPEDIVRAVKEVATEFGGDVKQTESELLAKLLKSGAAGEELKINDLISGMQIDRMDGAKSNVQPKRSQFVRKSIDFAQERRGGGGGGAGSGFRSAEDGGRQYQRRKVTPIDAANVVSVNLFGEKPLGIFSPSADLEASPDILTTWSRLQERELALAVTHPPSNHFQKMALWTEQGKLWRFPIDNEQGLDEEAKVSFTEHIFLDRHLEGWCPARGPIRHFMELVCVGLSKNPYYSVQQKIDHILWFRQYFDEKKELLEQVIIDQTTAATAETAVQQ